MQLSTSLLGCVVEHLLVYLFFQSVTIPWAEVISNGEKSIVYYEDHVQVRRHCMGTRTFFQCTLIYVV